MDADTSLKELDELHASILSMCSGSDLEDSKQGELCADIRGVEGQLFLGSDQEDELSPIKKVKDESVKFSADVKFSPKISFKNRVDSVCARITSATHVGSSFHTPLKRENNSTKASSSLMSRLLKARTTSTPLLNKWNSDRPGKQKFVGKRNLLGDAEQQGKGAVGKWLDTISETHTSQCDGELGENMTEEVEQEQTYDDLLEDLSSLCEDELEGNNFDNQVVVEPTSTIKAEHMISRIDIKSIFDDTSINQVKKESPQKEETKTLSETPGRFCGVDTSTRISTVYSIDDDDEVSEDILGLEEFLVSQDDDDYLDLSGSVSDISPGEETVIYKPVNNSEIHEDETLVYRKCKKVYKPESESSETNSEEDADETIKSGDEFVTVDEHFSYSDNVDEDEKEKQDHDELAMKPNVTSTEVTNCDQEIPDEFELDLTEEREIDIFLKQEGLQCIDEVKSDSDSTHASGSSTSICISDSSSSLHVLDEWNHQKPISTGNDDKSVISTSVFYAKKNNKDLPVRSTSWQDVNNTVKKVCEVIPVKSDCSDGSKHGKEYTSNTNSTDDTHGFDPLNQNKSGTGVNENKPASPFNRNKEEGRQPLIPLIPSLDENDLNAAPFNSSLQNKTGFKKGRRVTVSEKQLGPQHSKAWECLSIDTYNNNDPPSLSPRSRKTSGPSGSSLQSPPQSHSPRNSSPRRYQNSQKHYSQSYQPPHSPRTLSRKTYKNEQTHPQISSPRSHSPRTLSPKTYENEQTRPNIPSPRSHTPRTLSPKLYQDEQTHPQIPSPQSHSPRNQIQNSNAVSIVQPQQQTCSSSTINSENIGGHSQGMQLAEVTNVAINYLAERRFIQKENQLMRDVKKRWDSNGIQTPDTNLTFSSKLRRGGQNRRSRLEGERHYQLWYPNNNVRCENNNIQSVEEPSSKRHKGMHNTMQNNIDNLKKQLQENNAAKKNGVDDLVRECEMEKNRINDPHGKRCQMLKMQQDMEIRRVHQQQFVNPYFFQCQLLQLRCEHQQQREHVQWLLHRDRKMLEEAYEEKIKKLVKYYDDKCNQLNSLIQQLENQDLAEEDQQYGPHVMTNLAKGPCRSNDNRCSEVTVCLPADIATCMVREDEVYDHYYSY